MSHYAWKYHVLVMLHQHQCRDEQKTEEVEVERAQLVEGKCLMQKKKTHQVRQ